MIQVIIGIIVLLILTGITGFLYYRRKHERPDQEYLDTMTLDKLLYYVKQEVVELVKVDNSIITNDINFETIVRTKSRLDKALTDSVYGIDSAREIVIALIRDLIEKHLPKMEDVLQVIDFDNTFILEPMIKFEILLYVLGKDHGKDVIRYLEDKYAISKETLNENGELRREFSYEMLDEIFVSECIDEISYAQGLDIISILIYQQYKGFGCIDTLRGMRIDGLNFGTSGSVRYLIDGKYDTPYRTENSVWVQIDAKWVHFSFLDFRKEGEMRRIVNQIMSWGVTAPMTEKNPSKVNDMYDGSRCTAIRPPSGETWACFVRKFSDKLLKMRQLLVKPGVTNEQLVYMLIYFLMRGEKTTAFTGQQNTGKTTMMKAAIEFVKRVNIRVLEMSFELGLREAYPDRNILTVKNTEYISASQLQDLLKKTDGYLSMVGEVAEDIVAARMIQFCLIGSAFTMFSHHGKNDFGLINGLTNSLVASGEYSDHNVAMSTVLDAIKSNVHIDFIGGERVVQYISEIVKEDEVAPYQELKKYKDARMLFYQLTELQKDYYTRSTDRVRFKTNPIIIYDPDEKRYYPYKWYTDESYNQMLNHMDKEDAKAFRDFYAENWGDPSKCMSESRARELGF